MFGQQQISIEQYLANLDARKATLQLQLSQVNTQMSNIRAHYEQSRANFLFKQSRGRFITRKPPKDELRRVWENE